jgi:haloacetate dehalogenase
MAADQVSLMRALGFSTFDVAGHDRGARVAHRMALDHQDIVRRLALLDIVATRTVFATVDTELARSYYHWFFLIQPPGFPERLIGADPDFYLDHTLRSWAAPGTVFHPEALTRYRLAFRDPATIAASCEDYRAAASIDLEHAVRWHAATTFRQPGGRSRPMSQRARSIADTSSPRRLPRRPSPRLSASSEGLFRRVPVGAR